MSSTVVPPETTVVPPIESDQSDSVADAVVTMARNHRLELADASTGQMPAPAILAQNWPNPFNPSTSISFELRQPGQARLEIFDLRGRLVTTLLDKELGTGTYIEDWDGTDANGAPVASGVYFYRLSAGGTSVSRKMLLLK